MTADDWVDQRAYPRAGRWAAALGDWSAVPRAAWRVCRRVDHWAYQTAVPWAASRVYPTVERWAAWRACESAAMRAASREHSSVALSAHPKVALMAERSVEWWDD